MHKPFSIRPPYLPSPAHTAAFPLRFLSHPPPPFGVCNPPERPPRFPPPLSTLAPFSYPLILSQPFSLRKCRSAIHLSSSSTFLSFLPFPFHFLYFPYCLSLSFSLLFFFLCVQGHSTVLSSFFLPFFTSEKSPAPDFFSITLFLDWALPVVRSFSKSNCLTSGYLTPLINSRYKSLRFGLFYGTRPSLEPRKKWSLSLFTFFSRPVRSILMYKASSKR